MKRKVNRRTALGTRPQDIGKVAVKFDAEKVPFHLLSTIAIEELCKVLAFGAKKYDDHNWRKGFNWSRLCRASIGHVAAFMRGENLDDETKLCHIAHAMCCNMFLLEHVLAGYGVDDRWDEYGNMPCSERGRARRGRRKRKKEKVNGRTSDGRKARKNRQRSPQGKILRGDRLVSKPVPRKKNRKAARHAG